MIKSHNKFIQENVLNKKNRLTWKLIDSFIHDCELDGWAGKCGIFAIALNTVLFNKNGVYIIATNEHLWNNNIKWVGHIGVEYNGYLYDSNGVVQNIEHFKSWGQPLEDDVNPLTNTKMDDLSYDSILIKLKDFNIPDEQEFILKSTNHSNLLDSYIKRMVNVKLKYNI